MFDRLIESNSTDSNVAPQTRSRYFVVSTIVIGVLFFTAVAVSLYAVDLSLGNDEFEMSSMLAPIVPETPAPEVRGSSDRSTSQSRNAMPTISRDGVSRTDETPAAIPNKISVSQNSAKTRSYGDPNRYAGVVTGLGSGSPSGTRPDRGGSSASSGTPSEDDGENNRSSKSKPAPVPPPLPKKTKAPEFVKSSGVVNGEAISLPKPTYPATAIAANLSGEVRVQVTIDEMGKVVSAKAASGHPIFRVAAERAAYAAKFNPTYLSKVPVKVTGIIVYNFKRN